MPAHKPKVVVFDVGDVLLDWKSGLRKAASVLGTNEQVLYSQIESHIKEMELGNMDEDQLWEMVVHDFSYSGSSLELKTAWITGQVTIAFTWKLVKELHDGNYQLAILTNNWKDVMSYQVMHFPEYRFFSDIVDSSVERLVKPDMRIYKRLEEKLGLAGEDLFLIDDTPDNIKTAKALGWQTFLFYYVKDKGVQSVNDLRRILLPQ